MVGAFRARSRRAGTDQTVHSAKSWLSNSEADRTARILPWDSQEEGHVLFAGGSFYTLLAHLKNNWERAEVCRSQASTLRLNGSRQLRRGGASDCLKPPDAGIAELTMLEEPAAAFYAWIAAHFARSNKELFDGQVVLVCDVGGGDGRSP